MSILNLEKNEVEQIFQEVKSHLIESNVDIELENIEESQSEWNGLTDQFIDTPESGNVIFYSNFRMKEEKIESKKTSKFTVKNKLCIVYIDEKINNEEEGIKKLLKEIDMAIENEKKIFQIRKLEKLEKYRPNIFFFSKNISDIALLQGPKNPVMSFLKKEIQKSFKNHLGSSDIPKIFLKHLHNSMVVDEISINIQSRSLRATANKYKLNSGNVYTANLYDLVEMYNKLGNRLFQHNLRFGSKDEMDLDSNIRKTLSRYPDQFWYLNNGITLLVGAEVIDLRDPYKLIFNNIDQNTLFSVINGAQTLNSSAKFFYGPNNESISNSKEDAWVVLRVVAVDTNEEEDSMGVNTRWVSKVAVALNRQKPIKVEDLGNAVFMIQQLNNVRDKDYGFEIIKTGQSSSYSSKKYTLTELVKVLVACYLKNPGMAKNTTKELLKIKKHIIEKKVDVDNINHDNINSFEQIEKKDELNLNDIEENKVNSTQEDEYEVAEFFSNKAFRGQEKLFDQTTDEIITNFKEEIFNSYYKPVNYLMRIYSEFDKNHRSVKRKLKKSADSEITKMLEKINELLQHESIRINEEKLSKIMDYGNFHMLACYVWSVNSYSNEKFEKWIKTNVEAEREITPNEYSAILISFTIAWLEFEGINEPKVELNNFKNTSIDFDSLLKNFTKNYAHVSKKGVSKTME